MRLPRTRTLVWVGLFVGLVAGLALGATFAPGDAGPVDNGVPFAAPDGPTVTLWGDTNVSMSDAFPDDGETVDLDTEAGNITLSSAGATAAHVHTTNMTGPWTNVTSVSAGSTWLRITPEDKHAIQTRGDVTGLSLRPPTLDDGTADFAYSGSGGDTVSVRLHTLPGETTVKAVDANTGTFLDATTTDGSGQATFDMPSSDHSVLLQTHSASSAPTFANPDPADGATTRYDNETLAIDVFDEDFSDDSVDVTIGLDGTQVHSETIGSGQTVTTPSQTGLAEGSHTWTVEATDAYGNTQTQSYTFEIDHYDPEITNPSPVGLQDSKPGTIEADFADADFGRDRDSLDVTLDLDGTQIHSETISGNQTVDVSMPSDGLMGGAHTYTWEVTDQWGQTTERTETYSVPDTLFVRNERDHSQILDTDISMNLTFFGADEVYTRETSDGTLNMTGLPVTEEFIAVATPSDGNWTTRARYIQDIFAQQSIYLLNTTAVQAAESRFMLEDPTGQYDSQSVGVIQRPINVSGSTSWQTVHSDRFGSEGVTSFLQEGQRYRVKVRSGDGDQQTIGPYRPTTSETVTVQPGAPTVDIPEFEDGYGYNAHIQNTTVEYRYDDPANETDRLAVWIHEKGNESNLLRSNTTYFDLGSAYEELQISANESEQQWVVNFVVDRDGETIVHSRAIGNQQDLFAGLAPGLQASIGVLLILLLGGSFTMLNASAGTVIVSLAAGLLWWVGLLSGIASGILIAIAITLAVAYHIGTSSGP